MGILERLAEFLGGQSNSGKDFSLATYKRSLDAQLEAKKKVQDQQVAQETERIQREAVEESAKREFSGRRREQAEVYRGESGIETLLLRFDELIKQDSTKNYMYIGGTGVFQRVQDLPRVPQIDPFANMGETTDSGNGYNPFRSTEERIAFAAFSAFRDRGESFDVDSIFDIAIWWDGEEKIARDFSGFGCINRLVHQYIKYFIVETDPDGDIVFHSKMREPIPRNLWMNNRSGFEKALGKTFNRPQVYIIEEQHSTHGPITGMS